MKGSTAVGDARVTSLARGGFMEWYQLLNATEEVNHLEVR